MTQDLQHRLLAHLHANHGLTARQLASILGVARDDAETAIDTLVADGHVQRRGEQLVPTGASHAAPGLFIATERSDAESIEVDDPEP
jgi:predicted ArsR family transcriptional regulator